MPYTVASGCPGYPWSLPSLGRSTLARLEKVLWRIDGQGRSLTSSWLQRALVPASEGATSTDDVVAHARQVWTWSMIWERRGRGDEIRRVAEQAGRGLVGRWRGLDPEQPLYARAFAIHGLSTFGRVFDDPEAVDAATRCFETLEATVRDREFDGYDPGTKDTDTHVRLIAAYTSLLDATSESRVRERLHVLSRLAVQRLRQHPGYVHRRFAGDWRPVGPPVVSYGHDFEIAWLLLDALRALGGSHEEVVRAAMQIAARSADEGFDHHHGGYFLAGTVGDRVTDLEKVGWVQAEALAGLFWLLRISAEERFLYRFERTLDWIEDHHCDPERGDWFGGGGPDGILGASAHHALRSMVFVGSWIRDTLGSHSR